jgi:uncharacterized RDD family membrane protein YckC
MSDGDWHYALGNDQYGPITLEGLTDLISKGTLTRQDRVWRPGMNQWMPAGDLAALEKLFTGGATPVAAGAPAPAGGYQVNPAYRAQTPQPSTVVFGGMLGYQTPGPYTPTNFAGYAGFWRRVAAYIIDAILLAVAGYIVSTFIMLLGNIAMRPNAPATLMTVASSSGFVKLIMQWLYFALMESSSARATLGKMALQIDVTDLAGNRISFARATGRYFGKILSGLILCIGFLMVAWTEHKQGLHDIMAGTLVVNKPY